MNFTDALKYPFNSKAKVASIVLIFTIAFAVFLGMILNSFDWEAYLEAITYTSYYGSDFVPSIDPPSAGFIPGVIGLLAVLIIQGFWLSGYGINVIRHVMDGYHQLPSIKFGSELLTGFYLFLSSILYGLLFIPLFIIFGFLMIMFASPNGQGGLSVLMFCSAFLVAIPLTFLMMWAYFVGMARCAAEGNRNVLFQIFTNLRIARENVRASLSLSGFQFLLAITFWFISQIVNTGLQFATVPFLGNGLNQSSVLTIFVLFLMISFALSIIQQFSNMHLIAQYAYKIGIYSPDSADFDFSKGPW